MADYTNFSEQEILNDAGEIDVRYSKFGFTSSSKGIICGLNHGQ